MQSLDILAGVLQHTYISSNYTIYPYKISVKDKQFTCASAVWINGNLFA